MKKQVKVGGKILITVGETPPATATEQVRVLNTLIGFLYCFLERNAFLGDPNKTNNTIRRMLEEKNGAIIHGDVLTFMFPEELQKQFLLESSYSVNLNHASISEFYCTKLIPQCKLRCDISVDAYGHVAIMAIRSIQRTVLYSKEHLRRITLKKCLDDYIVTIHYSLIDTRKKVLSPHKRLMDAVYELQDYLKIE